VRRLVRPAKQHAAQGNLEVTIELADNCWLSFVSLRCPWTNEWAIQCGLIKEMGMTTKSGEAANGAPKKRKPAAKKQTLTPAPSREEIARLAEKYWAERGWPEGSPEQDWLRAENELKNAS
jgi:hypothetical protein